MGDDAGYSRIQGCLRLRPCEPLPGRRARCDATEHGGGVRGLWAAAGNLETTQADSGRVSTARRGIDSVAGNPQRVNPLMRMDSEDPQRPNFRLREQNGIWYVIADWPTDGEETVRACLSEREGLLWIRNQAPGWLLGRRPPIGPTHRL